LSEDVEPGTQKEMIKVADVLRLEAQIIGRCEDCKGENVMIIDIGHGKFRYDL